jgi:hypothetical protein
MSCKALLLPLLLGGVETVLLAGITDYVLGGIYYQQQESHYVVVTPPTQVIQVQTDASLIPLVVVGAGRALYRSTAALR